MIALVFSAAVCVFFERQLKHRNVVTSFHFQLGSFQLSCQTMQTSERLLVSMVSMTLEGSCIERAESGSEHNQNRRAYRSKIC